MYVNEMPPHLAVLRAEAVKRVARGERLGATFEFVHSRSGGVIGTIWVVREAFGVSLADARDLVELSPALNAPGCPPPESWYRLVASIERTRDDTDR